MDEAGKAEVRAEFGRVVNMTPTELERWLETEHSREVGRTHGDEHESVGHQGGRRIVEMRRERQADLTDDDYAHMRKVVGYCHRHLAQRPEGDVSETRWRYSFMNWGHSPMKGCGGRTTATGLDSRSRGPTRLPGDQDGCEPMSNDNLLRRITVNKAIFGGKLIIRGMRISVELVGA